MSVAFVEPEVSWRHRLLLLLSLLPLKKPWYNGVKKKIAWIKITGWLLLQVYETSKEYFTFICSTMASSYWMVRDPRLNFSSNMITLPLLNSHWKCKPLRYDVAMQSSSWIFCPLSYIKTSLFVFLCIIQTIYNIYNHYFTYNWGRQKGVETV